MNTLASSLRLQSKLLAPTFVQKDIFGRLINLDDYKDKKVFIGFFRHAGCPFCNIRVHTLTKFHKEFKDKGLEMIFFFESPEDVMLRSTFHQEVSPIPLIADPQKKIYAQYGIEESGYKSAVSHITTFVQTAFKARKLGVPIHMMAEKESIKTMPAEFLIDKNLMIKDVHYAESLTDRMSVDKIRAFANAQ